MKTSFSVLTMLLLWNTYSYAQNCSIQIPQDTFVCTFSYTLNAQPPGGQWSNICDLSTGLADFFTINDSLTSITVPECGDYFLQFKYAEIDSMLTFDTISLNPVMVDTLLVKDTICLEADTMHLRFTNPSSADYNMVINVSARYPETSCLTNDTINCESSFSLQNPEPLEMEWTFEVLGLCNTSVLNTTAIDSQNCQADQILFDNTSFSGTLSDTTIVLSNRFVEIDPVTGDIIANPFQEALNSVVNEAIASSSKVCPLPVFCNNSPPWCIDTLRDTSTLIVPVRAGGQWTLFPETDSATLLLDTTTIVIGDSTFMFVAYPFASAYDARFDVFQIDYAGDTIPSLRLGVISLQWEENWEMDTLVQILPRLVDTCCGGGLNIRTDVFDPPPPLYDCAPFQVVFIEELKTHASILECDEQFYSLRLAISGGIPPYQVTGLQGILEDSIFTALDIPIATAFSLTITDQGDCSTSVEGDACSCVGVEVFAPLTVPLRCDEVCTPVTGSGLSALSDSLFFYWEQDTTGITIGFGDSIPLCDTGLYRFVATEFFSACRAETNVVVTQNIPVADTGDSITLNCNMPTASLGGDSLSSGPFIFYHWSGPSIDTTLQNLAFPEISLAGTYELIVWDTLHGCADTNAVNIGMDFAFPVADAGEDRFLSCVPLPFRLGSLNSSTGEHIEYQWTGPPLEDVDDILQPRANREGVYVLAVKDLNNGCISLDTTIIHPFDSIQFTVNATPSCWNDDTAIVTFENVRGGQVPYSYSVGGEVFRPVFVIGDVQPGVLEVIVRDRRGCESVDLIEIERIPPLENPPTLQEEFHYCGPIDLQLDLTQALSPIDSLTYEWSDGTILPVNQFTEPGDYQVIVTSTCESYTNDFKIIDDSDIFDRFQVPNVFSPNQDGANDVFRPLTSLEIEDYELVIYNRWGQKVFRSAVLGEGWDGRINTKFAASDVYIWAISAKLTICDGGNNQLFFKGDLTLIR